MPLQNNRTSSIVNFSSYVNQLGIDSPLVLGTWSLGGSHFGAYDTRLANTVIQVAYERGIRQFDSASFYAKGQSQSILRKALVNKPRDSYVLQLKVGLRWAGNQVLHDATRDHITCTVLDALRFFNCDTIDVFLLHWPDPDSDIRIACDALSLLCAQQKIAFWGLCNIQQDHIPLLQGYDYSICHCHYNPLYHQTESLLKLMFQQGVVTLGYSPFEQGLLVNPDYSQSMILSKRDIRNRNPFFADLAIKQVLQRLFKLDTAGFSYSQCIIQWLLDKSFLDYIIFGARYLDQLISCCDVLSFSTHQKTSIAQSDFYCALSASFKRKN